MLKKIIIIALATYQIVDLLTAQNGPFDIFIKLREYFGVFETEDETIVDNNRFSVNDHNLVGNILACPYCTNVWVAGFVTIVAACNYILLVPFAAMGIVTVLLDYNK